MESPDLIEYKQKQLDLAIQKINNENILKSYFYNLFKWILSYFTIYNSIYYRYISVELIKIRYNSKKYFYNNIYNHLIILDNGIRINYNFIPYENIIIYMEENDKIVMDIFAKLNPDKREDNCKLHDYDKILKLELCSDVCEITISCKSVLNILLDIKRNMYYHIKYNKINQDVIGYYKRYDEIKEE
jgi:hypothetical protein